MPLILLGIIYHFLPQPLHIVSPALPMKYTSFIPHLLNLCCMVCARIFAWCVLEKNSQCHQFNIHLLIVKGK